MKRENLTKLIESVENERLKYSAHHIIKIIAVSKYASENEIREVYNFGQRAFGENKVQDLKIKSENLSNLPIEWHFIGHLQENKINLLLALKPHLMQSLDSLKLAHALQKRLESNNLNLNCLLQINSSNEKTKGGFSLDSSKDAYSEISQSCPNIKLKGVMTIGANSSDIKVVDSCFRETKKVFDDIKGAQILSCGMSDDYKIAIRNGANMLRIGGKIFK